MTAEPDDLSNEALQRQRERLRVSLARANTVTFIIVLVVLILAGVTLFIALRSESHARQSARERARAEQELWRARLAQARAARIGGQVGRRFEALGALRDAASIRPARELRDEAIANLALTDLGPEEFFFKYPSHTKVAVFDPAMKRVALATTTGIVRIVQAGDGRFLEEYEWPVSPKAAVTLQWSVDGEFLAACSPEATRVWNVRQSVLVLSTGGNPYHRGVGRPVDFSPNSRLFAVGVNDRLELYDLPAGRLRGSFRATPELSFVRLHPQKPWVASVYMSEVQVWDLEERQLVRTFTIDRAKDWVNCVAWSGDGRFLAAGCQRNAVYVWDTMLDNPRNSMILEGHDRPVIHLAFHPRNDRLLSHSWGASSYLWGLKRKQWAKTDRGSGLQFSHDGTRLSFERPDGLGIWPVVDGGPIYTPLVGRIRPHQDRLDFSPDGRWLAAIDGQFGGVWLWDLRTKTIVAERAVEHPRWVQFSPDGRAIFTAGHSGFHRWPLQFTSNGEEITCALGRSEELIRTRAEREPALSPDGRTMVVLCEDTEKRSSAVMLDLATRSEHRAWPPQSNIFSAVFSPDGKRLLTSSGDSGGLSIWESGAAKESRTIPMARANLKFSPDARWLLASTGTGYEFRDGQNFQLCRTFARDNPSEQVGHGDFSPDGGLVAMVKSSSTVELIDASTLDSVASVQLPEDRETSHVRFSRDGQYLAMFGVDGHLHLWNIPLLRKELAGMGLDWEQPGREATAASNALDHTTPFSSQSSNSFWIVVPPIVLAICAAVALGLWVRRYQRGMLDRYLEVDAMIARRNALLAQTQSELFQSQKMKALGTLAAGIAHDFNNLLSVIRMANKLTGEASDGNPDVRQNVALVEKTVAQGKAVVRSMLGYSRQPGERGRYSVAEVVEETLKMLRKQFLGGIVLDLNLDHAVPEVEGVRNRLEQILLNLLVNASEAMGAKGMLRIAVDVAPPPDDAIWVLHPRRDCQCVQISISDSGPGMTPELRQRIFEPFFTTKTVGNTRGTGLGLSMVYAIAEEEGLGLAFETAPGEGATFRLFIPPAVAA